VAYSDPFLVLFGILSPITVCMFRIYLLEVSIGKFDRKVNVSLEWWYRPIISELGRLKQEDLEFKASLDYIARPCPKKKKKLSL
jgi:hypothetical protein